jgi:hypothetical protein
MISDYKILGIDETNDLAIIKSAFRKRIKELHPDVTKIDDDFQKHLLFVETCNAYNRLIGKEKESIIGNIKKTSYSNIRTNIALHSDQAFVFYRNGIKYFSKIHPFQWNIDTTRMLNTRIAGQDEEQEIIKNKVLSLAKLFPKAYYYFSIVVHEYPESEWAYDAKKKMNIIENRTTMYKKIIESFSTWNVNKKELIQKYHEKYMKHKKTRDDLSEG